MKIVRLGIWAATCVALSACTGLLTMPVLEGCYSVDALDKRQRIALGMEKGNPILLIGGENVVCACYLDSSLAETGEGGGRLVGASESGHLVGASESGRLTGVNEGEHLVGAGEKSEHLAGASESGHLAGAGESAHLVGVSESGHLVGASEGEHLAGSSEGERLTGVGENGRLSGNFSELSCRIVSECSGFQLIGYELDQIMVLTNTGQKSVPASCVTW